MPRFHGHLKASLQPLSGVIKVTLPIETPVIHVPLSGRVGGTLPHKSYSSLSWEDQTANGHLHGQSPRSGFAVIGPFEPMPSGTGIAPPRCHPPPDGGTLRHVNNSLPGPVSEGSVHGNESYMQKQPLTAYGGLMQGWRNDSRGGGLGLEGPRGKGSPSVSKGPKPPIQLLQLLINSLREVKRAHFVIHWVPRVPPRNWNWWGPEGKAPPGSPGFLQPWANDRPVRQRLSRSVIKRSLSKCCRLSTSRRAFSYRAASSWNRLSPAVADSGTRAEFLRRL